MGIKNYNLACILSHCDNDEKIAALSLNIKLLKQMGFDILLSSHIPLSDEITSLVNYFIYDKSNPVLRYPEKHQMFWKSIWVKDKFVCMESFLPDYGFTVFNQIKKIGAFCKEFNYDNYTFVNYDVKITDSMIEEFKNIETNIISRVKWRGKANKEHSPSLILFSLKNDDFKQVTSSISKEDYVNQTHKNQPEDYLSYLLRNVDKVELKNIIEDTLDYKILEDEYIWNLNTKNDYFKLFYCIFKKCVLLYDLKNPILFNINGEDKKIEGNTLIYKSVDQIGYYDFDNQLVDITSLFESRQTRIST